MYVIKADGRRERFDFNKIVRTAHRAGVSREDSENIAADVQKRAYDGITTKELLDLILDRLNAKGTEYASRYDLKRAIMRLGPSGFTFEKLIAEMFSRMGYSVSTDVIVKGKCISHELDVVAEKDGMRFMIECKYKNFPGSYIGIHKALYVWARFEDLQDGYNIGKCQKFDVPYLVCNTKLSDDVKEYAQCKGLKLMSWDYPAGTSISSILTEKKMYPVTVLRSVTHHTLELLSGANCMMCDDLTENLLIKIGVSGKVAEEIMREAGGVLKHVNSINSTP